MYYFDSARSGERFVGLTDWKNSLVLAFWFMIASFFVATIITVPFIIANKFLLKILYSQRRPGSMPSVRIRVRGMRTTVLGRRQTADGQGRWTEDFPPVRPPQEWNRTADPFITSVPWALVRMRVRKTILILFLVDATFSDLSFERCFTFKIEMRIATLITRHQVDCIGIAIIAKISYAVTKIEILFIIFPIKWMLGYQF